MQFTVEHSSKWEQMKLNFARRELVMSFTTPLQQLNRRSDGLDGQTQWKQIEWKSSTSIQTSEKGAK